MKCKPILRWISSFALACALALGASTFTSPAYGCGGSTAGSGCRGEQPAPPGDDAAALVESILRLIGVILP
jgi:hypothetical protein